ncbi:MAG: stage V sporulation protein AE [Eubacteriales bacterium]|nr:stage V sporulation protein AE [Eubacteriales bacterium]
MDYIKAFAVGGILCLIGQVLMDKTAWTPARILTGYVVTGVILSAMGLYGPLAEFAGAGASVPLTGFGHLLAQGVKKAVAEGGALGILRGGFTAASAGLASAVFFALLCALIFRSKQKRR